MDTKELWATPHGTINASSETQRSNHPFVNLRVNERFRLLPFVQRPQSPGRFTAVPNDGETLGSVELRSCGPPIVSIAAPGRIRFFPDAQYSTSTAFDLNTSANPDYVAGLDRIQCFYRRRDQWLQVSEPVCQRGKITIAIFREARFC